MPINNTRLIYLDNMRAGAILMVVIIHSMGYCGELSLNQRTIIAFFVHKIAVPVFFFVDGYLSANFPFKKKPLLYSDFIKKSFRRLMVPWFIFTILYTLARWVFEYVGFLQENLIVGQTAKSVIWHMYGSVYAPQMYFLFSLFLIRLNLPLIYQIMKPGRIFFLFFFCIYMVFYKDIGGILSPILRIEGGQEPILHALWGGQFYLFGAVLKMYEKDINSILQWIIPLSLIMILLFQNVIIFDQSKYIGNYSA